MANWCIKRKYYFRAAVFSLDFFDGLLLNSNAWKCKRNIVKPQGTPWATSTDNVKKPQSQMYESCWKLKFCKAKQKHFWFQSHIWFRGLLSYKISLNKQTDIKQTLSMTIISSLGGSGLLWGIWKLEFGLYCSPFFRSLFKKRKGCVFHKKYIALHSDFNIKFDTKLFK